MIDKIKKNSFEGINSTYDEAEIVVWGIPFDGTCSNRPGTRFGPSELRSELDGLETYSPYLNKSLEDYKYCDIGDLEISFGNTNKVMEGIYNSTISLLEDNKKLITIGGEHLISYSVIKAYIEKYKHIHVIHLDAHADLRNDYLDEKFSHATVMRLVYSMLRNGKMFQFGIRSGTKDEFEFGRQHTNLVFNSLAGIELLQQKLNNEPVYLSVDLDVLDPSIFPGTGTPEPGGINYKELLDGLVNLSGLNIVGADIVELAPHYDHSGVSNVVAAKTLREIALLMASK